MKNFPLYQGEGTNHGRKIKREFSQMSQEQKEKLSVILGIQPDKVCAWGKNIDPFLAAFLFGIMQYDINTLNLNDLIAMEYRANESGWPVIFIESSELINSIYNANFEITSASLELPFPEFSISFPRGTVVDGVSICPTFFGKTTNRQINEYRSKIYNKLRKSLSKPTRTIALTQLDNSLPTFMGGFQNNDMSIAPIFAAEKDFIDFVNSEKRLDPAHLQRNPGTSMSDLERVFVHTRLIACLLIYLASFKDRLTEGFPKSFNDKHLKYGARGAVIRGKHRAITCRAPIDQETGRPMKMSCLVRGTFCCLKHDRFTKKTNGEARWIWRKAHARGVKIDPHTAA